jgi:glycosyltransferase involved in cell wall biosynthesis
MKLLNINATDTPVKNLYNKLPANIVCFSHLRWDFVFQRPQHLLTRLAQSFRVFFIEEPIFDAINQDHYTYHNRGENVQIIVPHLAHGGSPADNIIKLKALFDNFMENKNLADYGFWYYTPMALEFSRKYLPELVIFDCMDELSAFKFAPEELKDLEKELLKKADIVFTGGQSLYEAKKNQHSNMFAFPSSIEKSHFETAREIRKLKSKGTNSTVTLGFYGVIDERFDIELIRDIATVRSDWQIVLVGPVVKIDPEILPRNENIQYLGSKKYEELPTIIANWDIALIPFLLNESTRFISPTKTPEYLAAGLPVISTAIKDVVNPYGKNKLISIGSNGNDFIAAAEQILNDNQKDKWLSKVDAFLAQNSWDKTCSRMIRLMNETIENKSLTSIAQ